MENNNQQSPRQLADRMLAMVDPDGYRITERDAGTFIVAIAETSIIFDIGRTYDHAFERLASAIEARMAYERARAMLDAAGERGSPLPLWLVAGSGVLAHWLAWSGAGNALRRVLTLTESLAGSPVSGSLDRRARRELGQGGARIRVWSAEAVAEQVELADSPRIFAMLGRRAEIRVSRQVLPETFVAGLAEDPSYRRNASRPLAEILDHPFVADADLRMAGLRNAGGGVIFDVETNWGPLAPVPKAAWAAIPSDADVAAPWKPTVREVAALYGLVDLGRYHKRSGRITGDAVD